GLAGEAAEGYVGTIPFAFVDEDTPGIHEAVAYARSQGRDVAKLTLRFVQGWTTMKVVGEALRRAGGQTDGESLKAALETLRHFDTGGVCDTITFTPQSHQGARKLRIYHVKQGRWQPITPFIEATR